MEPIRTQEMADVVEVMRGQKVIYRHLKESRAETFMRNCCVWFGKGWLKDIKVESASGAIEADLWLADRGVL